jgi:hypothetical protein
MGRILLAIRVFFATLFSAATAGQVRQLLADEGPAAPTAAPEAKQRARPSPPPRSDAVTLLAALQREARFVDFVQQALEGYSDAQIGAAARDVHRGCAKVLNRLFALKPLCSEEEGTQIDLPKGFDAGRYRLTGNVAGEPPFRGQVVHHGWEAARCELPTWSGNQTAAQVVAPAEVELQ